MPSIMRYCLPIAVLASGTPSADGFIHYHRSDNASRHSSNLHIKIRHHASASPLQLSNDSGGSNDANNDDDESILDELRKTKKEMFGADITQDDELKQAAANAENEFLSAMLEQTQQFKQMKSTEGSEKAVEAFMDMIQEEDEANALRMKEEQEQLMQDSEIEDAEDTMEDTNTWQ